MSRRAGGGGGGGWWWWWWAMSECGEHSTPPPAGWWGRKENPELSLSLTVALWWGALWRRWKWNCPPPYGATYNTPHHSSQTALNIRMKVKLIFTIYWVLSTERHYKVKISSWKHLSGRQAELYIIVIKALQCLDTENKNPPICYKDKNLNCRVSILLSTLHWELRCYLVLITHFQSPAASVGPIFTRSFSN